MHALLITPSAGLGGGIERYASALEECLWSLGYEVTRRDFLTPLESSHSSAFSKLRFAVSCNFTALRLRPSVTFVLHPALAVAVGIWASGGRKTTYVVYHGTDIVSSSAFHYLWTRHTGIRAIAVSNQSGEAVGTRNVDQVKVLHPGLGDHWYHLLRSQRREADAKDIDVLSVFRLSVWQDKGAGLLLDALDRLALNPKNIVIAGTGSPPPDLLQRAEVSKVIVSSNLSDAELADLYGRAKVVVLATVPMGARSGEGFGYSLLEGAVAGAAVVGPCEQPTDAYLPSVTGLQLRDPSAEALIEALWRLLGPGECWKQMGALGSEWAASYFAPDVYRGKVKQLIE